METSQVSFKDHSFGAFIGYCKALMLLAHDEYFFFWVMTKAL